MHVIGAREELWFVEDLPAKRLDRYLIEGGSQCRFRESRLLHLDSRPARAQTFLGNHGASMRFYSTPELLSAAPQRRKKGLKGESVRRPREAHLKAATR